MSKAAVKPPTDMHKWMSTGSLFLPYGTSEDYAQADEDGPTNHTCTMANADSLEFDTFKDKHEMPTNQAGLFSFISLVWLSKLMWKAYRQGIHQEDLWQMAPNDSAELNVKRLERLWKDEQLLQGEKASVLDGSSEVLQNTCHCRGSPHLHRHDIPVPWHCCAAPGDPVVPRG